MVRLYHHLTLLKCLLNNMSWLLVALLGHFANAGAFVIDKILLVGKMKYPLVYVFYINALGLLVLPVVPFLTIAGLPRSLWITTAVAGATFTYALLAFFTALKNAEASRVVPLVGAAVPIWTFVFAWMTLSERLTAGETWGIGLLVLGAVLISYERKGKAMRPSDALLGVIAGALFALSYTYTKVVFNELDFISGFVWIKVASFTAVLPLLLVPGAVRRILRPDKQTKPTSLFFIGQASGALGFVMLNYAIELAPRVTIVNALQGVQYAFLFVLIVVIGKLSPRTLQENFTPRILAQKMLALLFLGGGLLLVS